jgi:hypothetical protein
MTRAIAHAPRATRASQRSRRAALVGVFAVLAGLLAPIAGHAANDPNASFTFLADPFTQALWGATDTLPVGIVFAANGDILTCLSGGRRFSASSTSVVHGSTVHTMTPLSGSGCQSIGITNHPDGFVRNNAPDGVRRLDPNNGLALVGGPYGLPGSGFGIATDPQTGWSNNTLIILHRDGTVARIVPLGHTPDGIAFHASTPKFVAIPTVVTVGDVGVPATIEVRNDNIAPDDGATNTVCNSGDASPCPVGGQGITLIPSCGQLSPSVVCTPAAADPGVFQLSATGQGQAGTAGAGVTFDITLIDPGSGQVRFTPQPAGTHVTLPGAGSLCRISFTFDVLKVPTVDQNPGTPGVQTVRSSTTPSTPAVSPHRDPAPAPG